MLEVPCKIGTCNAVDADASEVVDMEVQKLLKMENTKGRIIRKPMTIVVAMMLQPSSKLSTSQPCS